MEHTLEILVELEVDGVAVTGFPFRHVSQVDYVEPFVGQDFGDTGFTAPIPPPASQLQALLITSDQDFAVKLNGEPTIELDIICRGFVLLIGTAISITEFLTVHAVNIVPAQIWGFVAGKQA